MKKKIDLFFAVVLVVVAIAVTATVTSCIRGMDSDGMISEMFHDSVVEMYDEMIVNIQTKHLKAQMIEPPENWIELHGDKMDSWTAYNSNMLVQTAREVQLKLNSRDDMSSKISSMDSKIEKLLKQKE